MLNRITSEDWYLASKNIDDDFHTDIVFLRVSTESMANYAKISNNKVLLYYRGFTGAFYYSCKESKKVCGFLINRILNDTKWRRAINSQIHDLSDRMMNIYNQYSHIENFGNMADKQIIYLYKKQLSAHIALYTVAWIPEVFQTPNYGLTDYLLGYLNKRISDQEECKEIFNTLTTSNKTSIYKTEADEIENIAREINHSRKLSTVFSLPFKYLRLGVPDELRRRICALANKYGCISYHGYGKRAACTYEDYLIRVQNVLKLMDNNSCKNIIIESSRGLGRRKNKLFQLLDVDKKHQELFCVYADFAISKAYRRLAELKNFYYLDKLIFEISSRLGVPEKIVRFMKPEEIISSFQLKAATFNLFERRSKEMLFYRENTEEYIITGKAASDSIKAIETKSNNKTTSIIKGTPVYCGSVTGRAVHLFRKDDETNVKFKDGDIIISVEADPDLLPFICRAGAIVTDQGGVTCHVAIIAREFRVPCITGTKYATSLIKTGDIISVDAYRGQVEIIKHENQDKVNCLASR